MLKKTQTDFTLKTIEVTRKAHIYINEKVQASTRYIWIAAHGYGQTGSRILSKFNQVDSKVHNVICPEGLSLFYWGGVQGPHAASWMTSRNRLDEIDDFCNYLDAVYDQYVVPYPSCKIILLGFSQGATTLYRWVHKSKRQFDYFINWAGWFPEDIDMSEVSSLFESKHLLVYGDEDPYLTEERTTAMNGHLQKASMNPMVDTFNGKHEVDKVKLSEIINSYIS